LFRYLLKKLLVLFVTLVGISLTAFTFIRLIPGDPIILLAGERGLSDERYAELKAAYGYDKSIPEQFFNYVLHLLQGDFGSSLITRKPVLAEFTELFPATLELSFCALLISIVFGVLFGIIAALKKGTIVDSGIMSASLVGYSMPIFWWALLLIVLFSGVMGLTPVSGRIDLLYYFEDPSGFMLWDSFFSDESGDFISALSHLVLPSVVLSTIPTAVIARQTRSAMLEVLGENYVIAARARGLSGRRVIFVHALRNAAITIVTVIGLQVGLLVSGAILTETIFAWPGIGKWIVDSIFRRDYPVVQSSLIIIAGIVMVINFLVDAAYAWINPKIRS